MKRDESVIGEQLERLKFLSETVNFRRGSRTEWAPADQVRAVHRREAEKVRQAYSQGEFRLISNVLEMYASRNASLQSLKPILITNLLLETFHKGRYLICRTLENVFRYNAVQAVVEDCAGNAAVLSLYNYAPNFDMDEFEVRKLLPVGSILVIKEPYCKMAGSGAGAVLRCDSPSDIVRIHKGDPNYKLFKVDSIARWKNSGVIAADLEWTTPVPITMLDWKNRGNALFKTGHHEAAIRAYSRGIELTEDESNEGQKLILISNRSCVYLELGYLNAAFADAETVLKEDPSNVKALYRAASSCFRLGEYLKALDLFERLCALDNSEPFRRDLEQCYQRVLEQETGNFNFTALEKRFRANNKTHFEARDIADFWGPLKIADIPGKGRGLVAKEDIEPGRLLALSRAFEICHPKSNFSIVLTNFKTKIGKRYTQVQLATQIAHQLKKTPSLANEFYALYPGPDYDRESVRAFDPDGNVILDADLIDRICSFNAFSVEYGNSMGYRSGNSSFNQEEKNGSGLWLKASYFNHSCVANAQRSFKGNLMIVRAKTHIAKGEEVTLSYVPCDSPVSVRQKTLNEQFHFKCTCARCLSEC